MPPIFSHPITRFLRHGIFILLFTMVLLEIVLRGLFWHGQITITDKEIRLLPLPILNEQQTLALKNYQKAADSYIQFDARLGWSIRPNTHQSREGVDYTANTIGIRSLREYELTPPATITRIAAFGPSFTHSDEVNDSETWAAQMEKQRPRLEVMNWGVGAYGTDQAFLRYQYYGKAYRPHVVLIDYEEENHNRNINRFHPFYYHQGLPMVKPVFVVHGSGLQLLENPFKDFADYRETILNRPNEFLKRVCPGDFFCDERLYHQDKLDIFANFRLLRTLKTTLTLPPPAIFYQQMPLTETTIRLLKRFTEEVISNGAVPVVVFFPMESKTIAAYEQGKLPAYHPILTAVRETPGIEIIDLGLAFIEAKQTQHLKYEDLFVKAGGKGHYSVLGNQVVAHTLLKRLPVDN